MGYNSFIHGIKNPPAISDYNLQSVVTPRSGMMVQYKQVTRDTDRKCVVESGIAFATLVCTYKVTTHWEILTDELYSEAWNYNEVFKMNIVILAGLLVATLVSQSKGAAMIPEHPQTAFCKVDFGEALSYKTFIPCYTHALDIGIVLVIFNVWVIFSSSVLKETTEERTDFRLKILDKSEMFEESDARVQYFPRCYAIH